MSDPDKISLSISNVQLLEERLGLPLFGMQENQNGEFEIAESDIRFQLVHDLGSLGTRQAHDGELPHEDRVQLQMLYNLEKYIYSDEGLRQSELRDHQKTVFEDIYGFIAEPAVDEAGNPIRKGYVKLPTGSGKTAIFSTLVDVLTQQTTEDTKRLKALVLVPKLDLVTQTIGTSEEDQSPKGFARFAKGTRVSEYHGNAKSLEGDAVVMTYQSLPMAIERGEVDESTFDLVICDEAHRSLSKKRKESLDLIAKDKTVIGLTASPSFETRHVEDYFTERIHELNLRECIELGMLSPVRCFTVCSDSVIETVKKGEFSDEELASLIDDEWRNQKAIEFAKAFIEQGQQGVIACLPGDSVKHAKIIAKRLSKEFVSDPVTGNMRPVRAMTIHGNLDNRNEIYSLYEAGGIDVLTYVDQLTEGWDSEMAKFIINLRPTTSPVSAIQRIGRVLRKSLDDDVIANVVEFVDRTDKDVFTFFNVFDEVVVEQGAIIGGRYHGRGGWFGGRDLDPLNSNDGGGREVHTLELSPELLRALAEIDHITVNELEIRRGQINTAGEGIVSINAFAKNHGFDPNRVAKAVEAAGLEVNKFRFGARIANGLTPEQQQKLLEYPDLAVEASSEEIASLNSFSSQHGVSISSLRKILKEFGIELSKYTFGRGQVSEGITPSQQRLILAHPQLTTPSATDDTLSVGVFASQLNISPGKLKSRIEEAGLKLDNYKFSGRIAPGITKEQQAILRQLK